MAAGVGGQQAAAAVRQPDEGKSYGKARGKLAGGTLTML
jgi:hypothetical protein